MNRAMTGVVWAAGLAALTACQHYTPAPLDPSRSAAALQSRSFHDAGLRAFMESVPGRRPADWPPRDWALDDLTLVALYFNPTLELARAEWKASRAAMTTAGASPNPVLNVTPGLSANAPAGISPWFPMVTLDLPLETAGKRGHRIAVATHLADAARLATLNEAWHIRSELRATLLEDDLLLRRMHELQRQDSARERIQSMLDQRLEAGVVSRLEVGSARLARSRSAADLAEAQRQWRSGRSRLARVLGLPLELVRSVTVAEGTLRPLDRLPGFNLGKARDAALTHRADVLAALSTYAASESQLRLELAKQYPDLHLAPGYQFDQGEHKWSLGLSVELPVLNRNQGPIAEARARRDAEAVRFLALQARILADLERAGDACTAAEAQIEGLSKLRQAAEEQVARLRAGVSAGGTDRMDLELAILERGAAELSWIEADGRRNVALGELEDALQSDWKDLPVFEVRDKQNKEPQP